MLIVKNAVWLLSTQTYRTQVHRYTGVGLCIEKNSYSRPKLIVSVRWVHVFSGVFAFLNNTSQGDIISRFCLMYVLIYSIPSYESWTSMCVKIIVYICWSSAICGWWHSAAWQSDKRNFQWNKKPQPRTSLYFTC